MKKRAVLAGLVLAATIAGWLSHSDALPLATQESKAASVAQEWSWFVPGSPIVESPERGGDVRGNLVAMAYLPILTREGQWVEVVHRGRRGWIDTAREPPHDRDNARRGGLRARAERVRGNDPWQVKAAKDLLGERASEMKVGSYRLFTDVQDQELLSYLDGAATAAEEAYFARYGRLPSGNPLRSAVLFANEATYRRFTDEEDIQLPGTSTGSAGSGVLVFYAEGKQRADLAATLVHEITHLLNDRALAINLPPWLEEGLASDLGSLWVEVFPRPGEGASVSDRVSVAIQRFEQSVLALNASLMAGQLPPLSTLLTLDRQGFYFPEETSGDTYAQSLALIRYLLDEKEGLAEGFRAFLGRIASGRPTDLLELVELDGREMELGFRHWLQGEASAASARFTAEYPGMEISVMEGGGLRFSGSGLLPPPIQAARPANQQAGEPPDPTSPEDHRAQAVPDPDRPEERDTARPQDSISVAPLPPVPSDPIPVEALPPLEILIPKVLERNVQWTTRAEGKVGYQWEAEVSNPNETAVAATVTVQLRNSAGEIVHQASREFLLQPSTSVSVIGIGEIDETAAVQGHDWIIDVSKVTRADSSGMETPFEALTRPPGVEATDDSPPSGTVENPAPLTEDVIAPQLIPESVQIDIPDSELQSLNLTSKLITARCLVRANGTVADARVLRIAPEPPLDEAKRVLREAIRNSAITHWRFLPASREAQPIAVWYVVTIRYEPAG